MPMTKYTFPFGCGYAHFRNVSACTAMYSAACSAVIYRSTDAGAVIGLKKVRTGWMTT
jgi:hypothetical protein